MLPEVDWGTLEFTYTGQPQGPDPTPSGLEASKGDAYEVKYSGDGYPSGLTVTVTGKAAGSTTIWAKISDEVSASCIVTVSAASTNGGNNSGTTSGGSTSGSGTTSGGTSGGTTTKEPEVTVEEPKTEEGSNKTTVEVNTETTTTTNSSGQTTAKADIPEEKMEQAVESAIEAAKENETAPVVEINVETKNADVLEIFFIVVTAILVAKGVAVVIWFAM